MGFFRFRRSVKLFPGVRWNIGSKSSSLSFGGRGYHYTVGSSGSRTTVGIPGTGLSYTEFHGAHRRVASRHPRIPEPSEEWLGTNTVDKTLNIPDRRPDEPPIRPDQLDRFRELEHVNLKGFDLHTLGCDQADALLHQIQMQQKEVSKTLLKRFYADHGHAIPDSFIDHCYDHQDKPWKQPYRWGCFSIIVAAIALYLFVMAMYGIIQQNLK
jgi:hypothetical protein